MLFLHFCTKLAYIIIIVLSLRTLITLTTKCKTNFDSGQDEYNK